MCGHTICELCTATGKHSQTCDSPDSHEVVGENVIILQLLGETRENSENLGKFSSFLSGLSRDLAIASQACRNVIGTKIFLCLLRKSNQFRIDLDRILFFLFGFGRRFHLNGLSANLYSSQSPPTFTADSGPESSNASEVAGVRQLKPRRSFRAAQGRIRSAISIG